MAVSAILFTGDIKLQAQIEMWVRQSMADTIVIERYASFEAYKDSLEKVRTIEVAASTTGVAAAAPPPRFEKIRIFIVDIDVIKEKPIEWIANLQKFARENEKTRIEVQPAVLMMAYDGGPIRLDTLQNETVDDLILKPLDKPLLLQKIEFLIAEGRKISPNFLFRAKGARMIEVGRDVMIDEISEFAVGMRSPGAVPEGAFALIHCDVFGPRASRRVIGRVYESVRHPVREGEYLVRFSYFGVSVDQLSTVRRFIKSNQTAVRPVKTWGSPTVAAPVQSASATAVSPGATAPKVGLSKELQDKMAMLRTRKFAVIDLSSEVLSEAKSILETSFKGAVVRSFLSYARFQNDLLKLLPDGPVALKNSSVPAAAPAMAMPPGEKAFPGGRISIILRGKTHEVARMEPQLKKTDPVFGRQAGDWTDKPDLFVNTVDREDKEPFDEFLNVVESGTAAKLTFRMLDPHGRAFNVEATGSLDKSGGDNASLIRIDLRELDTEQWSKVMSEATAMGKDPAAFRFDAILIEGLLIRPDPQTWYENLIELLRKTRVLGPEDQPPKIFVLADPKSNLRLDDFRQKGIADYSIKPLDRRAMILKYQAFVPGLVTLRPPEISPFVPCELHAKLGKEVIMDELGEYGLAIQHPTAFKEKSYMRFFSKLFGEEGEWVTGRCHSCEKTEEKTEDKTEFYRCQFMFFGPADDLLQRIRRWIREDYIAKKDGKS